MKRLVLQKDLEETHYYPFGLTMAGISSKALAFGNPQNKLRYNGYEQQNKEFADGSGLEWYDYKNRFYDNQIGRFFCVDRLASEYPYYTPYQFAGNEVPNAIDLDGLEPMYVIDSKNPIDYSKAENRQAALTLLAPVVILAATAVNPALGVSLFLTYKTGIPTVPIAAPFAAATTLATETTTVVNSTVRTEANLNAVAKESASALKTSGQSPATVIAGQDLQGNISVAKSGLNKITDVAPQLKDAVKSLGGIGAKANNNTVGACAEFNLANPILKQNPNMKPWEIPMSNAYRPKTGNVVDPCPNCTFMFKPPK